MSRVIVLACLGFAFAVTPPAFAAGEKMKGCSREAKGMKGEERKAFMKKCLSKDYVLKSGAAEGAPPPAPMQQERMKACSTEAKGKGLMGEERKKFMGACLKG